MKKVLVCILLFFIMDPLDAQTSRYMVFFQDKVGTPYRLDAPEEYLSARALQRRAKQGIEISETDLPVNPAYIEQVRGTGANVHLRTRWMNGVLVTCDESTLVAITTLDFVQGFEYAGPGERLLLQKDPAEFPDRSSPVGSSTTTVQNEMIGVPDLHAEGFRGDGMYVAVFDGGFEGVNRIGVLDHLFTDGQLLAYHDFVRNVEDVFDDGVSNGVDDLFIEDHGTRVLTTMAADNGADFVGTAPDATYILAVTEDPYSEYRIEEYNWLFAAEWADSLGVDVVNTSLGYTQFDDKFMNYIYEDMDGSTTIITRASEFLADRGVLVVTSAGNSGASGWRYISAPADAPSVLAVGAVASNGVKASFSSFGPTVDGRVKPDVSAQGVSVGVISGTNIRTTSNGTSFSSPIIAGYAASYWQKYPELSAAELRDSIRSKGHLFMNPNQGVGFGIPNYSVVLSVESLSTADWTLYPNPFGYYVEWSTTESQSWTWTLTDDMGRRVHAGETQPATTHRLTEVSSLAPGTYYIHLQSVFDSRYFRVVKR